MVNFLIQIDIQLTIENLRSHHVPRADGRRPFHELPDIAPRPFVLRTRPFAQAPAGYVWDGQAKLPHAVACPQRDQLVDVLGVILVKYAKCYLLGIHRRRFDERHKIKQAISTLQTFLTRQGAPRRHKRLWCQLDALANRLIPLADAAYPPAWQPADAGKLERELRRRWQEQQRQWVVPLYDALQRYGPARKNFPNHSRWAALAHILQDLGLEPESYEDLAGALRKRYLTAITTD